MEKFPVFLEFNKSAGVLQCKVIDQPYLYNVGCSNAGKYAILKGQTSCGTLSHQFIVWILLEVHILETLFIQC